MTDSNIFYSIQHQREELCAKGNFSKQAEIEICIFLNCIIKWTDQETIPRCRYDEELNVAL